MNQRRQPPKVRSVRRDEDSSAFIDRMPNWLRRFFEVSEGNRRGYSVATRSKFLMALMALIVLVLVGNAFAMMIVNKDFYMSKGEARFERVLPIATSRGMITDRNGEPLAVSTPVESVWGNPQELIKHQNRWGELAKVLGLPLSELQRKLAQKQGKEFVYLKRRINPDEAKRILAHKFPGVASQREYRRFYPQGESIAHILGFTNVDDKGQEGLELAFEDHLRGKVGEKRIIRSRQGDTVESEQIKAAVPGHELTLSIDRRVQYLAFKELRDMILRTGAPSGSAVIVDIQNGEVLAMANLPTFNPNAAVQKNIDAHRNRAVTDLVEPGSTMKPITVAAALEKGTITPNMVFSTEGGRMANGPFFINDTHNYGSLTVTGIITKSSNVGAAKIAKTLQDRYFYEFIHKLGYGKKPGSGFPGESAGLIPVPGSPMWSGTTKATMAYGYGLSATPLQIAMAYAALANGGKLITPSFVKGTKPVYTRVMDDKVAREVMKMMETVTKPGGTATQAAILGYNVAGKTGTARMVNDSGGYSRKYNAFFAGVVPVDNPRFAMVVVVNDPSGGYYGGLISGPVFRSVMEGTLRLMDVPPDDIQTWIAANARAGHPSLRSSSTTTSATAPQATAAAQPSKKELPRPVTLGVDP